MSTQPMGIPGTERETSKKRARLVRLCRIGFGVLLGLIGAVLAVGGVWLAALGGSIYYLIAGCLLVASGVLFVLGKPLGFYLYAAVFIFTVIWAFWEVGLSLWDLTPRLAGPFVLMIVALALLPSLPMRSAGQIRRYGLVALGVFAVALVVAIDFGGRGHDYLLIMAGGHHFMKTPPGDALIAYALPDK